jgi:transposase-like protein
MSTPASRSGHDLHRHDENGSLIMGEAFVAAPKKYPDELRVRAVRFVSGVGAETGDSAAEQLGVHHEAFRSWIGRLRPTLMSAATGRPRTRSKRAAAC